MPVKHNLEWDDSKNINIGDWLVSQWSQEIKDIDIIEIPIEFRKNTILGEQRLGPNLFKIDEEFLWILGMYIAEGSSSKRSISFALHKNEIEYQNRIISYFKKYGYNPAIRKTSNNGICIEVYSTTLANWWPKWIGRKCFNKKIPDELMRLSNNKTWALIQGIYDGDGSKSNKTIGQTSEILALQLVELLHRVGEQPLICTSQATALTPKGNKRKLCYIVSWAKDTFDRNRKGRWLFKEKKLLTKVKKVEEVSYSGLVYNLEVEGDHTYIVQGVVVHNCISTGFVGGYQQFFNPRKSDGRILVRFGPVEDDLKVDEEGLESIMMPDCWTLVYPTLKDHDFIIRFDEEGNEEFRYLITNVTRNKLLNSYSGKQGFKLQRVRKTHPIYMVKSFQNTASYPTTITTGIGFLMGPAGVAIPHTHTVVINENTISAGLITGNTSISNSHSHEILNGEVLEILSHKHDIIL